MSERVSVLLKAEEIINGERRSAYGDAKLSFGKVAKIWSVILNTEVTASQVALCMTGLKIVRECANHKEDNLIDAAGYLGLADQVYTEQTSHAR